MVPLQRAGRRGSTVPPEAGDQRAASRADSQFREAEGLRMSGLCVGALQPCRNRARWRDMKLLAAENEQTRTCWTTAFRLFKVRRQAGGGVTGEPAVLLNVTPYTQALKAQEQRILP